MSFSSIVIGILVCANMAMIIYLCHVSSVAKVLSGRVQYLENHLKQCSYVVFTPFNLSVSQKIKKPGISYVWWFMGVCSSVIVGALWEISVYGSYSDGIEFALYVTPCVAAFLAGLGLYFEEKNGLWFWLSGCTILISLVAYMTFKLNGNGEHEALFWLGVGFIELVNLVTLIRIGYKNGRFSTGSRCKRVGVFLVYAIAIMIFILCFFLSFEVADMARHPNDWDSAGPLRSLIGRLLRSTLERVQNFV